MEDKQVTGSQDRQVRLLLAEYEHMGESFLRNEELGESRVKFFITITGAVMAALATLGDGKTLLIFLALVGLLPFGILTLVRMVHRNIQTDKYLRALASIRRYFVDEEDKHTLEHLYFNPYEKDKKPPRQKDSIFSLGQGGLVETVGLINSLITAGLLGLVVKWYLGLAGSEATFSVQVILYVVVAVAGFLGAWAVQMRYVKGRYGPEQQCGSDAGD